jgi:cytochrome c oxidase accessory protein FixG
MSDSSSSASPAPGAVPVPDTSVQVVSLYQKTKKIYPRAVSGWFSGWRWATVFITQLVFYGLPWLMWHQRQAVLFDLGARRFYLFGLVLYPQDFIYLTGLLIVSAYALFLFTAVAGRLWCGYACPQTVYTELFMWIEHKFEGDRAARMKLDAAPWSLDKLRRKGAKQVAWGALSLWTGFTFVGYFTPIHQLAQEALSLGFGPWEWFWVLFYSFATYGNAGHMREQVCKYMCPYARFQSAMIDKDTMIITYDAERGEPRGSRGRKVDPKAAGLGACVDCNLCVHVCPTGIDIRKGLQYECIGCAACVDVCDGVMDKMGYARGLVRYDTQNGLAGHWDRAKVLRRAVRPRVLIYTAILVFIVGALGTSLWLRPPFRVDVVRDRASLARIVDEGAVENVYRLQVMNATESMQSYRVAASGLPGAAVSEVNGQGVSGNTADLVLGSAEARWLTVSVRIPPQAAQQAGAGAHRIDFEVQRLQTSEAGAVSVQEKSTFMVPR